MEKGQGKTYYVPALEKAFDVIEYLSRQTEALPLSVIAKDLGRSSSELFRIMDFLVQRKYVIKEPNLNSYTLSLRFFDLTLNLPLVRRIVEASSPFLHLLAADIGYSSHISIIEGGDIVVLNEEESVHAVYIHTKVGARIPASSTSSGRLLLSRLSDSDRFKSLMLDSFFQASPGIEQEKILEEVRVLSGLGYNVSPSKQNEAIVDIVLPIEVYPLRYAALAVPVSKSVSDEKSLDLLISKIGATVSLIQQRLNGTLPKDGSSAASLNGARL